MDRSTTGPPILNRSQQALLSSTGPNRPSYPQQVPTGPPILNRSQQALLSSTRPNRPSYPQQHPTGQQRQHGSSPPADRRPPAHQRPAASFRPTRQPLPPPQLINCLPF